MSVAIEEGRSLEERSRCTRLLSIIFPLGCLIVLIVGYAALGAVLFWLIEGSCSSNDRMKKDYNYFLRNLVDTVHDYSRTNVSSPGADEDLLEALKPNMKEFKTIWILSPEPWTFSGAMFFCCTVFTTVGYGQIYPETDAGKLVCILYAMVGIPLMLLVITDVGDILAILVSKSYLHLHKRCRLQSFSCWPWRGCQEKPEGDVAVHDGTYTFSQDVAPMDIKHVLRSQKSVKRKSVQLRNAEIFDRIIIRENLAREILMRRGGTLPRSLSCPELNRAPPQRDLLDLHDGQELERLDVPLVLILVLVFAYILFGGSVLRLWETELNTLDTFYFCFVTLTTIGFGDIMPRHPKFFMLTSLFIIVGMAILSMSFKLGQSRFVGCYRRCIGCITRGRVKKYEQLEDASLGEGEDVRAAGGQMRWFGGPLGGRGPPAPLSVGLRDNGAEAL
ncbi:hypothetical protein AAFF_G00140040 [Aldrovandia affinis]|uniref:Potassium channel domain-containing protein n=1 Tax=Aldrovandia affinis TaxID=143900 RepID=A0AAD7TCB4_9TELE|nr:hypothetical protein AAFF_G00140040 [Aldrovandia affinis]